jgi:hypothetical protein
MDGRHPADAASGENALCRHQGCHTRHHRSDALRTPPFPGGRRPCCTCRRPGEPCPSRIRAHVEGSRASGRPPRNRQLGRALDSARKHRRSPYRRRTERRPTSVSKARTPGPPPGQATKRVTRPVEDAEKFSVFFLLVSPGILAIRPLTRTFYCALSSARGFFSTLERH